MKFLEKFLNRSFSNKHKIKFVKFSYVFFCFNIILILFIKKDLSISLYASKKYNLIYYPSKIYFKMFFVNFFNTEFCFYFGPKIVRQ